MAGEANRVAEDVAAIAGTREQMAEKLQLIDQRLEESVGRTWAASDVVNKTIGTIRQLIVVARIGTGLFRFMQRRPWVVLGAAIGAVVILTKLSQRSRHTSRAE